MEVILREDVASLGMIGDIVNVRPGYARNYLLPQGLAVPADRRNIERLEHERRIIEVKKQRERGAYQSVADSLRGLRLEIEARAGRGGKLFGSVTNLDVHKLLVDKGFDIDRRRITLKEPIKEIGEYQVSIRVGQDISTDVAVVVRAIGGMLEDAGVESEPSSGGSAKE